MKLLSPVQRAMMATVIARQTDYYARAGEVISLNNLQEKGYVSSKYSWFSKGDITDKGFKAFFDEMPSSFYVESKIDGYLVFHQCAFYATAVTEGAAKEIVEALRLLARKAA